MWGGLQTRHLCSNVSPRTEHEGPNSAAGNANLADVFLCRTRVKPPRELSPRGLVAPDLTPSLPISLRKRLAGLHGYFLPTIPRSLMKPEGLNQPPSALYSLQEAPYLSPSAS